MGKKGKKGGWGEKEGLSVPLVDWHTIPWPGDLQRLHSTTGYGQYITIV